MIISFVKSNSMKQEIWLCNTKFVSKINKHEIIIFFVDTIFESKIFETIACTNSYKLCIKRVQVRVKKVN